MGGLTLDFRQTHPVVTNDRERLGKMDHFGGMYSSPQTMPPYLSGHTVSKVYGKINII